MKRSIRRLPDSELELMQIIWQKEPPVSRSDIEAVIKDSHALAATTILTLLTRLCVKGFLQIEKQGRANLYTPLISQREYLASESRSLLDRLYGGSIKTFANALCDSGISKEELSELRKLLDNNELYRRLTLWCICTY